MFIRTKRQKKNGKVYIYRVREERYWENGRVRSRYLGRADDDAGQRAIDTALRAAERQAREIEKWQRATMGETAVERAAREATERQWSQAKCLEETKGPAVEAEPEVSAQPGDPTPSSEI